MIQIAQILFILSVLVILHEFGHYITAKMFKMRVEKFYLFMDVGFSLLKKKIGETEWGIGWLPLGGYVKISGMIDESMDADQMKQEPQPWEFRSKPAWQRLIVMLGGIIVNILLAWFIYTVTYATVGKKYDATEKVQKNGLAFGEVGQSVGFKNGDKIISTDGKKIQPKFKWAIIDILLSDEVVVERNGKETKLNLTDEQKGQIIGKEGKGFIKARFDLNEIVVDSVFKNSKIGLLSSDVLIGFNGKPVQYLDQLNDSLKANKLKKIDLLVKRNNTEINVPVLVDTSIVKGLSESIDISQLEKFNGIEIADLNNDNNIQNLKANDRIIEFVNKKINYRHEFFQYLKENKGKSIPINVLRDNKIVKTIVFVDKNGKLGIQMKNNIVSPYQVVEKLSAGDAISAAVSESWKMLVYNVKQFKLILKPATGAYKKVQSPIGIARQLPETWNWEFIWDFTAMFSIGLAFMNLLPIPGLDGGHALFTIVEMFTGKKLSDKAAGYVQTGGMIFLLSLMALTFGKDIYQLILDKLVN
jgi:regulator of sigma E protease